MEIYKKALKDPSILKKVASEQHLIQDIQVLILSKFQTSLLMRLNYQLYLHYSGKYLLYIKID